MEKVKVGIIGCGRIGALLETEYPGEWGYDKLRETPCTHVGAFTSNSECEVDAVCDVDVDKAQVVAKKWKVPKFYKSYKRMMQNKFDIISVATPVETHADIVCYLAMHQNCPKIIFCEKPLAATVKDAERIVSTCNLNHVRLTVNFTRRWDPVYQRAKEVIDSGKIGEITHIIGYASKEKDWEGNIHMIDVLNWFSNGELTPCMYVNCLGEYLIFEVDVLGTKGRITISDNGRIYERFKSMPSSHYEGISELGSVERLYPKPRGTSVTPLMRAIMNLADCVRSGGDTLCTGQMGLDALRAYIDRWQKGS